MQLKHRNLGKLERKILYWWRTERDLKNQFSARIRRYFKNISQLKGQQKRYFLHFFGSIDPTSFISSQSRIS